MSVAGTGIAAGLAQTTHAAQQVSRVRDKSDRDEKNQFQQTLDRVDQLNRTAQTSDADGELPDHQAPGYENQKKQHDRPPQEPADKPDDASDAPPYHHIDIQA